MKSEKGITLITLIITIIIISILTFSVFVNVDSYTNQRTKTNFQTDIKQLREDIEQYYIKNKQLPILNKYTNTSMLASIKNPNDNTNYYIIDIGKLNVNLNYGQDYIKVLERDISEAILDITDVYIVNEQSHTVYYPAGKEYDEEKHYTLNTDYTKINVEQVDTNKSLVSQVTELNYGDIVNYTVTVNGITLGDGKNEDGTANELDYWKIFYNNGANVTMIYGDYLPNSTNLATDAGLDQVGGNYSTYGVYSSKDRVDLIKKLDDPTRWTKLLNGVPNLNGKATAKGTIDIETYAKSWNEKGYTKIYTKYTTDTSTYLAEGYLVGKAENPTAYNVGLSSTQGYNDTLYYPHKDTVSNNKAYWFASLSAGGDNAPMRLNCSGSIYYTNYDNANTGIRPIINLSSDVLTTGQDESGNWNINL